MLTTWIGHGGPIRTIAELPVMSDLRAHRRRRIPGVISENELYTLDETKARMRWTDSSLRSARRRGLRVLGFGKRRYVCGRDVLLFLEQQTSGPSTRRS